MRLYILLVALLLLVNVSISQDDKVDFKIEENLEIDQKIPIIVVLKDNQEIDQINSEDLIIEGNFSSIDGFYGKATKDGIEKLKDEKNVERIDYDLPVKAFLQDSINIVNAKKTHEILIKNSNTTGKGNTICVIDTGIDDKHPDLKDKVLDGYNFIKDNDKFKDDNGHGTHVAGIAAANGILRGIAKEANLIAIKSLDENGVGSISTIISGIEWCNLYSDKYNITAITLSLGTAELYDEYCDGSFLTLAAAVNNAVMKNITIVAATGNNGDSTYIASPACIKNVTAVAATDKNNNIASYSNTNKLVSLLAPGDNINSTYKDKSYKIISGTSMAAPHVAGAVALLQQYQNLEINMKETPEEIVNALNKSGLKISDNGNVFSLINIYEAVKKSDKKIPDLFNENRTLTALNNSDIDFSINATDAFLDSVWIGINYSSNFENITILSNDSMYRYTLKAGKFNSRDNISYRFYANDSNGNVNFTKLKSFIVSTINITLIKPENNSVFLNNVLNFTFIAIDPGDKNFSCSLYIDNELKSNITTLNNTISSFDNISLTGKKHQWHVICGNSSKYVEKSVTNIFTANYLPITIKVSPGDNSWVNSTNLTVRFNVSLNSDGNIWYMYKDLNKSVCLNCSSKLVYITFESFGNKTVYLFANNSDLEENQTKITFKFNLDTDGDNLPDSIDNDDDNDGILDIKDKLNGNTNNINRNFNDINMLIDNSNNLSQEFTGLKNVIIMNDGNNLIEFNFNFSDNALNLGNITIEKNTGSKGSVIIKGLNLNGNKKTVYVDKLNQSNSFVCIKDQEISSIEEISNGCSENGEFIVKCPGSNSSYNCEDLGNRFKVSGLSNSGIVEFSIASTGSNNQNQNSGSGGSSGGGGGGGSSDGGSNAVEIISNEDNSIIDQFELPEDTETEDNNIEEQNNIPLEANEITGEAVRENKGVQNWYLIPGILILILLMVILTKGWYKKL